MWKTIKKDKKLSKNLIEEQSPIPENPHQQSQLKINKFFLGGIIKKNNHEFKKHLTKKNYIDSKSSQNNSNYNYVSFSKKSIISTSSKFSKDSQLQFQIEENNQVTNKPSDDSMILELELISNWNHPSLIGLNSLRLFDDNLEELKLEANQLNLFKRG